MGAPLELKVLNPQQSLKYKIAKEKFHPRINLTTIKSYLLNTIKLF
jgi:hypothetical protein